MEIRTATPSPTPIPTRGTGLLATSWYAGSGDVRPRAAVLRRCGAVERRSTGVVVDAVRTASATATDVRGAAVVTKAVVTKAVVTKAVVTKAVVTKAVVMQAVVTDAGVQQHVPFLPLQGTRPRGAPV